MGKLAGRVALVTGAGQGIGRSVARGLAAEGAALVVNDLEADLAQAVVEEVEALGVRAVAVVGDVTADGFADRFVNAAVDGLGGLDIVVNNAGYTWDAVIQNMGDEQWQAMLDVHVTAPFRILRAAQPHIAHAAKEERAAGRRVTRKVVNVTSIAGTEGNAGMTNYSAAKAGVNGLTRALAREWGRYAVTVNSVGFGLIETRITASREVQDGHFSVAGHDVHMGVEPDLLRRLEERIPLRRVGTPDDAAGPVVFFCSPESDYVTGEVLICGGGYHV